MGSETGKQDRVCREIHEEFFVPDPTYRIASMIKKTEITEVFPVFRSKMACGQTKSDTSSAPQLVLKPTHEA